MERSSQEALLETLSQWKVLDAEAEPTKEKWAQWLDQIRDYSQDFLDETRNGKAWFPYAVPIGKEDFHLKEFPASLEDVLDECRQWIDFSGLNPASGGHLGYIPGGGILPAALGDFLAAVTNRYAGIAFANPGAVSLEHFLVRWMADIFHFPANAGGTLTSGGSIANLVAITAARDATGHPPSRWEQLVIYGSEQMHHCLHKALRIAGLGFSILREVPLDSQWRMRPDALNEQINADKAAGLLPFLIIGSAGTTDTGAVDPLHDLAQIAQDHHLWFHVDAAYGGFFNLVPEVEPVLNGIALADSLVIDPHKGLFLPYGTGAVLVRDVRHLYQSHFYQANYMQDAHRAEMGLSPADLSPELTRHFRGLRMYFALKMTGMDTIRKLLREKILLAQWFYKKVSDLGFETGPFPELSVVVFRWVPAKGDSNSFNEWLIREIQKDGRVFLSSTKLAGATWLRLAVLSFRSHLPHIEQTLALLAEKTKEFEQD